MVVVREAVAHGIHPLIFELVGEVQRLERQIEAVGHRPARGEVEIERLRGAFHVVAVAARNRRQVLVAFGCLDFLPRLVWPISEVSCEENGTLTH